MELFSNKIIIINHMQKEYKGQYKTFKFQMRLLPEVQKLFITLENKANYHLFRLTIDQDFLNDKHQWKNILGSPSQIYKYILNNFSRVVFQDNGIITIPYQFSHTNRVIPIKIRTQQINRDPVEILQLRFKDLHEQFNQERQLNTILIHQLFQSNKKVESCEAQIQQLKQQTQTNSQKIQKTRTQLFQSNKKVESYEAQIQQLKKQTQTNSQKIQETRRQLQIKLNDQRREQILTQRLKGQLKPNLNRLQDQNKRIEDKLDRKYNISQAQIIQVRKYSTQIRDKHQEELKQIKTKLKQSQNRRLIQQIVNEETDQGVSGNKLQNCKCFEIVDKSKFKVIQSAKFINLTLAQFNQWYTYVNQDKIQSSITFKITVKKATKHNMYIGLATSKIKGDDLKNKIKESCLYSFWGNLYNGGIRSSIGKKITTNDKFEMRIDYKQSILYFKFIDEQPQQIHIVPLPAEMNNQPLHLVVKSYFKGDQLDIQII